MTDEIEPEQNELESEEYYFYTNCGKAVSKKVKLSFTCMHCGSDFTSKGSLIRHYRRKHAERMLDCTLCQKQFISSNDLQKHLKWHSESQNFKCEFCDVTFAFKKHLHDHNKTHHREEKDIWLTEIPPVILKEYHVNKTGDGHYIYRCNLCTKAFYLKSDLQRHFLIHSGEKPFQCDICDLKFNRKSNLVRHLRKQHELSDESDKTLFVVNILTEDID